MPDDDGKILQLEKELERLSSQLNIYREQLHQLRSAGTIHKAKPNQAEAFSTANKTQWEFPSHTPKRSEEGLEKFIGLRLLHFCGIIALVIGISIGVKYAIDKDLISPAIRIALAYVAGISLYFLSIRLKKKYLVFSAILLSGAMASLYFTSFAAFAYYQLISGGLAFALMLCITAFTIYSAIKYNRQEIAILSMVGAYAIPFLISVNSGRSDLFFTYIILINIGISFLAFKKNWTLMTGLALFASWILYLAWGFFRYDATNKDLAVIVMSIFYLLFCVTSVGFALRKKRELEFNELLQFLVNSSFAFAAALLIFTNTYIQSVSAVTGFACIIFMVQACLSRILLPAEKILFNALTAFAVLCLIFYIGMRWSGMPVTMGWLLTAAGLFTMGVLSKINWLRLVSVIITVAALGKLVIIDRQLLSPGQKIISYIAIGVWMLLLSFFYQRNKKQLLED